MTAKKIQQEQFFITIGICLVLVVLTLAAYWPVLHCDFVNFDDTDVVTENPRIQKGLSIANVAWAFRDWESAHYWAPITVLSHMIDCQLFGLNAGMHHATSLGLHITNAVILFLFLQFITGKRWPSFFAAAIFAWHPLRVESVAWIAERKDLLSTLFFLLTLWTYANWVRKRGSARYLTVCLFYLLALMSKPMVVTLPFVLLLLDVWPMGRLKTATPTSRPWVSWISLRLLPKLIFEKIPFFVLAAVASVATFIAQKKLGAVASLHEVSISSRASTAVVAYLEYVIKTFWPTNLAAYYEPPSHSSILYVAAAAVLFCVTTVGFLLFARSRPYLIVGWLWFVGVLLPVSGLVQSGGQFMADRFTYIPMIGLSISLVWAAADFVENRLLARGVLITAAAVILVQFAILSRLQLQFWKDSEAMWTRVLQFAPKSALAHNNIGQYYQERHLPRAKEHFQRALELDPDHPYAHFNLGTEFLREGRLEDARMHFEETLRLDPSYAKARVNFGSLLARQGRLDDAITQFNTVLATQPENDDALNNLGMALIEQKKYAEARAPLEKAVEVNPNDVNAENNLATVLVALGQSKEAIPHYERALRLNPSLSLTHYKVGLLLAEDGQDGRAIDHFLAASHEPSIAADAHYRAGLVFTEMSNKPAALLQLREAVRLKGDWIEPVNNLAWTLATDAKSTKEDLRDALDLARRAAQLCRSNSSVVMDTLAAASARANLFADAVRFATQGRDLAMAEGQPNLAAEIETRLKVYRTGKWYFAP